VIVATFVVARVAGINISIIVIFEIAPNNAASLALRLTPVFLKLPFWAQLARRLRCFVVVLTRGAVLAHCLGFFVAVLAHGAVFAPVGAR